MFKHTLLILGLAAAAFGQKAPLSSGELERIRSEEDRRVRFAADRVAALRQDLGLNADHGFELRSAITDLYGWTHVRFRQLYKGVRIMGGQVIAHIDNLDTFQPVSSKLFAPVDLDVTPAVDAAAARGAIALEAPSGSGDPDVQVQLVILPQRTLQFTEDLTKRVSLDTPAMGEYSWVTGGYRLAWLGLSSASESSADDREPNGWLVDAASGQVARRWSLRVNDRVAAQATGSSFFFGNVQFGDSQNTDTFEFELVDPSRGGTATRNLNHQTNFKSSAAAPYRNSGNAWGDGRRYDPANGTVSANGQTSAVDVAFGVEKAWDALNLVFRQPGLDGKGSGIDSRLHFGSNFDGAFWHKSAQAAFFGDGPTNTDLETVAHELGHGRFFALIDVDGLDGGEGQGIAEGDADIFASLVEFHLLGAGGRGAVLPDLDAPWNWRTRMLNPALSGALRYWDSIAGERAEHAVGPLYGHLFVLLSRGAGRDFASPLYSRFFPNGMAGLGVHQAALLWFTATAGYLPDDPNFFELRASFLRAAEFLYGAESAGVRITENAFAAIGLGSPAVDLSPPAVSSVTISEIDEAEASMIVTAPASDDTGVLQVDLQINGQQAATITRPPYTSFVSIAGLAPGTHTVTARAVDYKAGTGISSASFGLKGVNQLVRDGGFESGGAWTASQGVLQSGEPSFLGRRHAAFSGAQSISQRITIGGAATSVNLSYRVRIEGGRAPAGDRLEVQVRDEQGAAWETVALLFDSPATSDPLANHYVKRTSSLLAYRGRTVELRFVSTPVVPASTPRFRIDNVSVVSEEPVAAVATADADNGERSLTLRIQSISGLRPEQIARVDFAINGEVAATLTAPPYETVLSTLSLPVRQHTMTAVLYDAAGNKLTDAPPVTFTVAALEQLIRNGGFEQGSTAWLTTGQTAFGFDTATSKRSFQGSRFALLAGKGVVQADELLQRFSIPETAGKATLTFRLRIDSQENTAADTLVVRIFDEAGVRLADAGSFNSLTNTKAAGSINGYVKHSFNLTPYAGRALQLHFQARENFTRPTSFIIDNVSIVYE